MRSQVSLCVVSIVRPTPHALVPAALPSTIGNLKALVSLDARSNALEGEHVSTRVVPIVRPTPHALGVPAVLPDSISELQALTYLNLAGNEIAGTCFCVVPIVR